MIRHSPIAPVPPTFYIRFGKRCCDLVFSFLALFLLSPFLLLVAIAVRLTSPGPAFFLQTRVGQSGKPFRILKFRTMRSSAAGPLVTAAGDPRVTPLGYWLRKTKIDEFPQLFNVLLGHMSLVGPRPEVPHYTRQYSPRQQQVLAARPGITSPLINFDEEELMSTRTDREHFYVTTVMPAKLEIDLAYVDDIRFLHDHRILFDTTVHLFSRMFRAAQPLPPIASLGSGSAKSKSATRGSAM
jgi:lipopolysaccharide/colanic/teichoic acid biosynthesis glycosyltransferase